MLEMEIELLIIFAKGFAVGLAAAAPLGPLGIICIRRTLQSGFFAAGIVGGLGTALADSIFGIISAFGLTTIAQFLKDMELPLRIFGGIFMAAMAWHVLTQKRQNEALIVDTTARPLSHTGNFISTFFLTLTNPISIIFFTMAFASLGIAENQSFLKGCTVVAGVFCGSMLWWIFLSGIVTLKRNSKALSNMVWVNRVTASLLILCAIWALGGLLVKV